jgi:hypothetical protein
MRKLASDEMKRDEPAQSNFFSFSNIEPVLYMRRRHIGMPKKPIIRNGKFNQKIQRLYSDQHQDVYLMAVALTWGIPVGFLTTCSSNDWA